MIQKYKDEWERRLRTTPENQRCAGRLRRPIPGCPDLPPLHCAIGLLAEVLVEEGRAKWVGADRLDGVDAYAVLSDLTGYNGSWFDIYSRNDDGMPWAGIADFIHNNIEGYTPEEAPQ